MHTIATVDHAAVLAHLNDSLFGDSIPVLYLGQEIGSLEFHKDLGATTTWKLQLLARNRYTTRFGIQIVKKGDGEKELLTLTTERGIISMTLHDWKKVRDHADLWNILEPDPEPENPSPGQGSRPKRRRMT